MPAPRAVVARGRRALVSAPHAAPGDLAGAPARGEAQQLAQLRAQQAAVDKAITLAQDFATLGRQRQPEALEPWLQRATTRTLEALQRFANGLRDDYAAVKAGVTLPWSNEHVAYCTSSPASWCLKRINAPTATACRNGLWKDEQTGPSIIIARSRNPATVIPVPHGLRGHAQLRRHLFCRPQTCLPQAGPPVLQAVRAAELGDMGGLEGQPREGAIPLRIQ